MTYEEVFRGDELHKLREEALSLRRKGEDAWSEAIKSECKKRWPRKRKNYPGLPEEFLNQLRESLTPVHLKPYEALQERIEKARKEREDWLYENAPAVKIESVGPSIVVKTSYKSSYSTQGYGAAAYAKGQLYPLRDALERNRVPNRIEMVEEKYLNRFELWAECPLWMADAAERQLTIGDQIKSWGNLNPWVYCPFLPHDIKWPLV